MVCEIASGQTVELGLPGGDHKMIAKSLWCGSEEINFSITGNETKTYSLSKTNNDVIAMLITFSIILRFDYLKQYINFWLLISCVFAGALFIFYTISIDRNKYLKLTHVS